MFNLFQTAVHKLAIFSGIDAKIVDTIIEECPIEPFKKWEIIMSQGEIPDGKWYIIRSGSVKVEIDGEETAILWEWEIVGEIALLNEEERTATVTALEDVETLVLSQEIMFTMITNDDNTINKEIMRRMEENLENE